MKLRSVVLTLLTSALAYPQAQTMFAPLTGKATSQPIPKHVMYRYFLGWVNDLNKKAVAEHAADPYEFSKPLQRTQFGTSDFDLLLKEAKALDLDLAQHDSVARTLIADYRNRAQDSLINHGSLPDLPSQLSQLQAARTAKLIQHMSSLQIALGPEKTTLLEEYMRREIAPHVSAKAFLSSPAPANVKAQ